MAQEACALRTIGSVLIGGLGVGYTLRATLDVMQPTARVAIAERSKEVIEWNRTVLAHVADRPLDDPRVEVLPMDVRKAYKHGPFDAILLDVDNGPCAMHAGDENENLYDDHGLAQARSALTRNGVLVIWSAGPEHRFTRRMEKCGFTAKQKVIGKHVLFDGQT